GPLFEPGHGRGRFPSRRAADHGPPRSHQGRGLAGIILLAVLVWVVLAVALLGQTLWGTHSIHHDVAVIDGCLAGINGNTSAVGPADRRPVAGHDPRPAAPSVEALNPVAFPPNTRMGSGRS